MQLRIGIWALIFVLVTTPASADAATMAYLMGLPGFVAVTRAVARVDESMREAAKHPRDKVLRARARRHINELVPAIVALAEEFRLGHLHDQDFGEVQTMLGGFVDLKSGERYRKFLEHPDAKLIPQSGIRPKYWRWSPMIRFVERAMIERAAAECQECDGGGEEGSGGGGNGAAEILMGIAAIIQAIAPMVIAGIQASADVQIAKINAASQVKMTEITADTSKALAKRQEEIALTQANIAQQISKTNNDFQTKRLDMQLAELSSARQDARQAEKEKQAIEQGYNQERINLAKKQSNDNVKLARETLSANLTQAGLTSGFVNSQNSGSRLSSQALTSAGEPVPGAKTGAGVSSAVPIPSSVPGMGAGGGLAGAAESTSRALASNATVAETRALPHDPGFVAPPEPPKPTSRATASRALLAAAMAPAIASDTAQNIPGQTAHTVADGTQHAILLAATPKNYARTKRVMLRNPIARGSTPEHHLRIVARRDYTRNP